MAEQERMQHLKTLRKTLQDFRNIAQTAGANRFMAERYVRDEPNSKRATKVLQKAQEAERQVQEIVAALQWVVSQLEGPSSGGVGTVQP